METQRDYDKEKEKKRRSEIEGELGLPEKARRKTCRIRANPVRSF